MGGGAGELWLLDSLASCNTLTSQRNILKLSTDMTRQANRAPSWFLGDEGKALPGNARHNTIDHDKPGLTVPQLTGEWRPVLSSRQ